MSNDFRKGIIPWVLKTPALGRWPTIPHSAAGSRTEPAVSVPSAATHIPAATAAAEPDDDRPRSLEFSDYPRIFGRNTVQKLAAASGCSYANNIDQIFEGNRNAMQRPSVVPGSDFGIGSTGLLERQLARDG